MLLVFTEDNVRHGRSGAKAKKVDGRDGDLVVAGTADTFEAAKAAALFEATARSSESQHRLSNDDTTSGRHCYHEPLSGPSSELGAAVPVSPT